MNLKYFKLSEFDSKDLPGSGNNMDEEFLDILDELRGRIKEPVIINSGYRTKSHNKKVGGSPNSSHLKGLAVDIHIPNNNYRNKLIREALYLGINRIGIYKTFVHLDVDSSKVQNVMWVL